MLSDAIAASAALTPWPVVGSVMAAVLVVVGTADMLAHRKTREITLGDAGFWSLLWIGVALGFYGWLRGARGVDEANLFLAGYTLEKTLSVDNLVVFIAIFDYFRIKGALQYRILRYGILGAVVLRLLFVLAGTSVLAVLGPFADLLFGAFVLWSAIKMASLGGDDDDDEDSDYGEHVGVRLARRFVPVVPFLDGNHFFVSGARARAVLSERGSDPESDLEPARSYATPALLCLLVIELSDVMFAFDSVPVVIAVTREPTLVFASMIFAIMGLRALYFILAALLKWLVHLEKSVVVVLAFIGLKLVAGATHEFFHWPSRMPSPTESLVVIFSILGFGVLASGVSVLRNPPPPDA
jgi:tellurite resistance protein TerC